MADSQNVGQHQATSTSNKIDPKVRKPSRPQNPIWRMMGMPNVRLRLPSRNWMIFLSITGSFSAAVIYDKRETKRVQRKWCKLVEHLAKEPLDPKTMPRTLTVFLEGPPGDGLRVAHDHFKAYVKPVLVASGLDWNFIQGRKEGDIRAELAEKIRALRLSKDETAEAETPTARIRRQNSIMDFDGPQGDIVVGRHTWKEYVRGLHEGWLGPIKATAATELDKPVQSVEVEKIETLPGITILSNPVDSSSSGEASSSKSLEGSPESQKKPAQPAPFILTSEYQSAAQPAHLPQIFDPSVPVCFPHILGFLNTPLRVYRFLNRRRLADSIGRDTAAVILASTRPYHTNSTESESSFASISDGSPGIINDESLEAEQATVLVPEEKDWHKSSKKRIEGEKERAWLDDVVLDSRIAGRMQKAELTPEDKKRAEAIVVPEEEIEGWIKGSFREMWRAGKDFVMAPKRPTGPNVGNLEDNLEDE